MGVSGWVCVCVGVVSVSVCVGLCVYVCLCVWVCLSGWISVCGYVCVYVCMSVCLCGYGWVRAYWVLMCVIVSLINGSSNKTNNNQQQPTTTNDYLRRGDNDWHNLSHGTSSCMNSKTDTNRIQLCINLSFNRCGDDRCCTGSMILGEVVSVFLVWCFSVVCDCPHIWCQVRVRLCDGKVGGHRKVTGCRCRSVGWCVAIVDSCGGKIEDGWGIFTVINA